MSIVVPNTAPALDRHRIGVFSESGRFTAVLDLNDQGAIAPVRDTFKITPPAETPIKAKNARRYGGSRRVGELHDNGAIDVELYLRGATPDSTEAILDSIIDLAEDSRTTYYYEWRPAGATYSTYFELRGMAWEPLYRWVTFATTKVLHVKVGFETAPLALGDPLDVYDDFSIDTSGDYTFDAGAGTLTFGSGQLVPLSTAEKRLMHTIRGYEHADVQATVKYTAGVASSASASSTGVLLKRLDDLNYLVGYLRADGNLRVDKVVGGVATNLATTASTAAAATSYWVRFRIEGNSLAVEKWTSEPTPSGTPASSVTYTLTGADAAQFGDGVSAHVGLRLVPEGTDWRYDDFRIEPYTYAAETLPATLDLPSIPGTAPARVDAYISGPGSGGVPPFGLIAWASKPRAAYSAPAFGVLEAESASSDAAFTVVVNASARGGNSLNSDPGATALAASWLIDPQALASDEFAETVDVEVWAMVEYAAALTSVTATLSARPNVTDAPTTTSREWGSAGRALVMPSSGSVTRLVRLGSLTLPVDVSNTPRWLLTVNFATGAATASGSIKLDYLVLVPARQRAASPTGKANDAGYPDFLKANNFTKLVRSDLSGAQGLTPYGGLSPDAGMGGQLLEFPVGDVRVLPLVAGAVPDDPTSNTATSANTYTATVRFAVWPRYFLTRST